MYSAYFKMLHRYLILLHVTLKTRMEYYHAVASHEHLNYANAILKQRERERNMAVILFNPSVNKDISQCIGKLEI